MTLFRTLRTFVLTALLLAACAPARQPSPPPITPSAPAALPTAASPTQPVPTAEPAPTAAARRLLASQRRAQPEQIRVIAAQAVDWPNSCLGVEWPDLACAQVITPGWRVILELEGQQYTYHTDAAGAQVILASAPPPQIGAVRMDWREAGSQPCSQAQIGADGVAFGACGGVLMGAAFAHPQRAAELAHFYQTYAPFEVDSGVIQFAFLGGGTQTASAVEQRALAEWVRRTIWELQGGPEDPFGLALEWHRQGGIAGFCDHLRVYLSGIAYADSCRTGTVEPAGSYFLTLDELKQLYQWVDQYAPVEREISDSATADSMQIQLKFLGSGTQSASASDEDDWLNFSQHLYGLIP